MNKCKIVILLLFSITSLFAQQLGWVQATNAAGWTGRDGHATIIFDNKIWVLGGNISSSVYKNDVWYSTDGINWTCATASAGWSQRSDLKAVVFDNKMWIMGGQESNGYTKNDVWYSTDGVSWVQVNASANWTPRSGHTSVVFNDKMWILGGRTSLYNWVNDVWYSTNGISWTRACSSAEWSARYYHTSVVYDNKIWMLGGYDGSYKNDVWNSIDGVNWTQISLWAGWSARCDHTSVIYDNKIWVLGGNDGSRKNDVHFSTDGVSWVQTNASAGWTPRSGHTSVIYNNKIWVFGGYYSNYKNDVWYSRATPALITPNGGENWIGGSSQIIKWRKVGAGFARYRLLLSRDGSLSYTDTISSNVAPTETSYNWTVLPVHSITCRMMVQILDETDSVISSDSSDNNFTIRTYSTVISPNGGEIWSGGSNKTIKWRTVGSGFARYRLLLSKSTTSGFSDDMTNFPSGWTLSPPTGGWTRMSNRYNSAPYSAKCTPNSIYNNEMDVYMTRPINISGTISCSLSFFIWQNTEGSDYVQFLYYNNGIWTTTWSRAGSFQSWQRITLSIPNTTTQIQFRFYSYNSVSYEGVYIDDVVLTATVPVYSDTIAYNVVPTDTTYNWNVSLINSTTCRVMTQILDASSSVVSQDASDADFTIDSELPSVPVLILPSNGSYTRDSLPRFWWRRSTDSISGINNYQLQYASNSGFAGGVTVNVSDTTYQVPTRLPDSTYYWHVRAIDRAGNQGNWSSTWSFEIDTRVPIIPNLVSPISGTWLTNTSVIFNWSQVTFDAKSPVRYILQVSTDTSFSNPIIDTTGFSFDTLSLNQARYYWRVRAYDLAGNQGSFSVRDSFGIDNTAPSVPMLVNPANVAMINNPNITFIWRRSTDNVSGVNKYTLQYAKNSSFTNPTDTILTDTTITITLTDDTTYHWHVKAQDRVGNQSGWSSVWSFELDTGTPTIPNLISPINGIWLPNTSVIFNWMQVTLNSKSPVRYILQVDTSRSFSHPIVDTTGLCYDTLTLNQARYFWKVCAFDLAGNPGIFSSYDSFGFDITAPSVPTLISPSNGAMTNNPNVLFVWNRSLDNVSGIARYTLEYAKNSGFTNPVDTIFSDTTIILTLLDDTTYYWKVRAQDRAGNMSNWSSSSSFELDTRTPSIPNLLSPINGIWLTNTSVIFNWTQVTFDAKSPVRYVLQIDTSRNFTHPILDTTALICDTIVLNQARYFWKVRAYDLAGNQGSFSAKDSFGVDFTAPSIPVLVSPANNAILTDSFVRFYWNRSTDNLSGVRNYLINIANNSNFINAFDTTLTDTTILRKLRDTTYYWEVKAIDIANNQSNWSSVWNFRVRTTAIEEITNLSIPTIFSLSLNTPNPFSRFTEIRYSIPVLTKVNITVFNSFGNEIMSIVNHRQNPGRYSVIWNGRDNKGKSYPSGIYFYRLETNEFQATRKMLMLK